jgi:hypothetical protein
MGRPQKRTSASSVEIRSPQTSLGAKATPTTHPARAATGRSLPSRPASGPNFRPATAPLRPCSGHTRMA